jgi:hypothetical protein
MQLINGQMRELCVDALHTHAVPEAMTCLAVSRTAPLPFWLTLRGSSLPSVGLAFRSTNQLRYSAHAAAYTYRSGLVPSYYPPYLRDRKGVFTAITILNMTI